MLNHLFSLEGRVALVTGGSRGIGRMIASAFLAQGACTVYITARKATACEATAAALCAEHGAGRCVALPIDGASVAGAQAIAQREAALHILVNNAGAAWGEAFETFPESGWDKVLDLHLQAPFFVTQALHGRLRAAASAQQPAKVIHIASRAGDYVLGATLIVDGGVAWTR